jgi:hypothetical protein
VEEGVVTHDERHSDIGARLRHLAEADRRLAPPTGLEDRVLQAWDQRASRHKRAARIDRGHWVLVSASGAAVLVAGAAVWLLSSSATPITTAPIASSAPADSHLLWLDDDPSSLEVYRLRATPALLSSMGMATPDIDTSGLVEIELIVGADGARRGTRLVPAITREEF